MKRGRKAFITILLILLTYTNINAASVTRTRTGVANGFSVTARFVFDSFSKQYVGKTYHTVNYMPPNTNPYAYYLVYTGEYVTPDNTTATQRFLPRRYDNNTGQYYNFPQISITRSY